MRALPDPRFRLLDERGATIVVGIVTKLLSTSPPRGRLLGLLALGLVVGCGGRRHDGGGRRNAASPELAPPAAPPPNAAPSTPSGGPTPVTSNAKLQPTNGGATVYDVAGDRTWLADANLPASQRFGVAQIHASGSMSYRTALAWVAALNAQGYLGHRDWTLPTTPAEDPACQSHHRYAFGFGCRLSAFAGLYAALGLQSPQSAVPVASGGPPFKGFVNLQPYLYWSATVNPTHEKNEEGYSTFSFDNGFQGSNVSKNHLFVIPMVKGRFEPANAVDRSKVVFDGENTWLADANLAATETFGVAGIAPARGSMPHDVAMRWVDAMNRASYLGQNRWQLPPTNTPDDGCTSKKDTFGYGCTGSPLGRLFYTHFGLKPGERVGPPSTAVVGPFRDVQPYLYWSCHRGSDGRCSAKEDDPVAGFGWSYSFGNGFQGTTTRDNALYVTAYHPGR